MVRPHLEFGNVARQPYLNRDSDQHPATWCQAWQKLNYDDGISRQQTKRDATVRVTLNSPLAVSAVYAAAE